MFSDVAILAYLALATVIVHLFTGGRYGFHRDELATLDDARHLAWGYVAYPPITPFFGRVSLTLFGASLVGFRLFASIAQAIAVNGRRPRCPARSRDGRDSVLPRWRRADAVRLV
jgi:hypothetical protein